MPRQPKNPLKDVRKALGMKEEPKEEPEEEEGGGEAEPTRAEANPEPEQGKEEEPKQATPKEESSQEAKTVPLPVDDILEKTKLLPIVIKAQFIPEIHYFLVVPVKDDEHKLLLGYTMGERDPVLKIQVSGNAVANLKLALQKA